MSSKPSDIPESRMLPAAQEDARPVPARLPARQLQDLPKDELEALAEQFGLDPSRYQTVQHLIAALHERRQVIAGLEREAMLDVIRWARRPVPLNAAQEQLAQEIVRITTMRFSGLSQRGLVALARLRGVGAHPDDDVPTLVKKLRKQEGFFRRVARKQRRMLGSLVARVLGEEANSSDYQFLPPQDAQQPARAPGADAGPASSLKEAIEEQGLFGGIAGRIKKSADSYVNQKLDEIEARIDRKLDEIDRRLGEWRDKEIANRIRILKITLWASVIVGVVSLLYSYLKVYWLGS
jgi:hypothetical protein